MTKRFFIMMVALVACVAANAVSASDLYKEGKALYDAKKYTEAVPKLRQAAEMGHKKAQYRLGRCYAKGHGVEENDALAFQWYQKSANQDYAKAQYRLGRCYYKGNGTQKNLTLAVTWFTKAAKQENADAQLALGKCYMKGKGVTADEKKARTWIKRAVNNADGGAELLEQLRREEAAGDEDAVKMLALIS